MKSGQRVGLRLEHLEPRIHLSVTVALQPGSDTGLVGDGITGDTQPVFDVTVNAPGTISIDWDGDAVADVTTFVPGVGTYTFMPGSPLADGDYPINVTFGPESASLPTRIDTTPPTVSDEYITAVISSDGGAPGQADIGDTITVTWDNSAAGDNNDDVSLVTVDLSAFGGSAAATMTDSGGGVYTLDYVVEAGSIDGGVANVSVTAVDIAANSATTDDTSDILLDNQAPIVTDDNIAVVISDDSDVTGVANIGDTIIITWDNSADGDNNADVASVEADIVEFGSPTLVTLVDDGTGGDEVAGDGIYTGTFTVVGGNVDAEDLNASVTVTDSIGSSTTTADTSDISVDSIAPILLDSSIVVAISSDGRAAGVADVGDTILVTWDSNEVDEIDAVTVDLSEFGGPAAADMYDDGTHGDATAGDGIWSLDYSIGAGTLDGVAADAAVTATDNAGNEGTGDDTSGLVVNNAPVATFTEGGTTVTVYDVVGEEDVDAANIEVVFDSQGGIYRIRLRGAEAMEGLGLVISGANYVDGIRDRRGGERGEIAFIAADTHIRTTRLKSGLSGHNINGLTLGGLTFADDVDGDGDTTDATGFYSVVDVHNVSLRGDVDGDVWLGGEGVEDRTLDNWRIKGGGFFADMNVVGDAGLFKVKGGDFGGVMNVTGDLKALKLRTRKGEGGTVLAGGEVNVDGLLKRAWIFDYETSNGGVSVGFTLGDLYKLRGLEDTIKGADLPFSQGDFEIIIG